MTASLVELISAETFWAMPETTTRRELVRGEVIEHMPPGGIHGLIAIRLGSRLERWASDGHFGIIGVESGFMLSREPDTLRSPDGYFVQAERVPASGVPEAFWLIAPDLVVEVVWPKENAADLREKVRDYLHAGTKVVWVIHPRTREVMVHAQAGTIYVVGGDELLHDEALLPGFSCRVAELFA
jgi:Uma2 family endonuclease